MPRSLHQELRLGRAAACAVALAVVLSTPALAQKGGKPGGGGGGGGYTIRALDLTEGTAFDLQHHVASVEVVGQSSARARYWSLDDSGTTTFSADLPGPVGNGSLASGINVDGVIVGGYWYDLGSRPLAWKSFATDPIELPVPSGVKNSGAEHVNDNGLVIGYLVWEDQTRGIAAWQLGLDQQGNLNVLNAIVIATGSQVGRGGVNNDGDVAGTLDYHAWRWRVVWNPLLGQSGGLQVVQAVQLFPGFSLATGINQAGTICGQYLNASTGQKEGYALEPDGTFHRLTIKVSSRDTAENVTASAINDASPVQVVGEGQIWRNVLPRSWPSVLWDLNGGNSTLPLDSAPFAFKPIYAIDDDGWAVGSAKVDGSTDVLPVLLIPR